MTSYIVLLEPGMWICDTGTTLQRSHAKEFDTEREADETLAHARIFRRWVLAKVCKVTTATERPSPCGREQELSEDELGRRKGDQAGPAKERTELLIDSWRRID